ncbi:MAG: cbb3-type cytochrome oxidase assembly protein CcoS [Sphingopyxis sp.]
MTGLALLIPVALGLGLLGLFAFQWALRSGQFDDLDGAALRVLIDEDEDEDAANADGAAAEEPS